MDVSGYPHYENVASNILEFFFDPKAEHGLGDLLLTSFFSAYDEEMPNSIGDVTIHREYGTDAGGRLDLLIEAEGFVIGIENKIFHHLANNLADYRSLIDSKARQGCKAIKVVLSLKPIDGLASGFTSVTYGKLWKAVRDRMGHDIHTANPKWLSYLIDFMETTSRLAGESKPMKEMDKFLIERHEDIEKLISERDRFRVSLGQTLAELKRLMDSSQDILKHQVLRDVYQSTALTNDYQFGENKVVLTLYLAPTKWVIQFAVRDKKWHGYLRELVGKEPLREKMKDCKATGNPYPVAEWPLDTPVQVLYDALCSWTNALLASAGVSSTADTAPPIQIPSSPSA